MINWRSPSELIVGVVTHHIDAHAFLTVSVQCIGHGLQEAQAMSTGSMGPVMQTFGIKPSMLDTSDEVTPMHQSKRVTPGIWHVL